MPDTERETHRRQLWLIVLFIVVIMGLLSATVAMMQRGAIAWPGLVGIVVLVVVIFYIGKRWRSPRKDNGDRHPHRQLTEKDNPK